MPNVYIPMQAHQYAIMFKERGWTVVDTIGQADLVQFVGGADVCPDLYGEKEHQETHFSLITDGRDLEVYKEAQRLNIPCVGICRGGQFLHVMNKGKLWQHVNGHALAQGHYAKCNITDQTILVTSTHHQMMRDDVGEVLLEGIATSHTYKDCFPKSRKEVMREYRGDASFHTEVEAVWHEDTKCLCFQPHPEMCRKDSDCQNLYFHYIEHFIKMGVEDDLL